MTNIAILMTTYNGEKFLDKQIGSILSQSFKNWKLYVRDDGSNDKTTDILDKYVSKDKRINKITDNLGNMGVKSSFLYLLKIIDADYFMFCDQDDIWLPNKIECSLREIKKSSTLLPSLVYTNLTTFYGEDTHKRNNFYSRMDMTNLNRILSSNGITGCTVMINRAMAEITKYINPDRIVMHDWWFGMCATTIGNVYYISTSTILYRQHDNNQVGTDTNIFKRLLRIFNYTDEMKRQIAAIEQAKYFIEMYQDELSKENRKEIEDFVTLNKQPFLRRISLLKKYKFSKNSLLGTISLWNMYIFLNNRLRKLGANNEI